MGDVRFSPINGRQPRALVILLHGVGSDPASMEPLAHHLINDLTDLAVVIPQAPIPFDLGGAGFQWFSVRGITNTNRDTRIQAALPLVQTILSREAAQFSLPLFRVGVCGFSQGAIMALALADQAATPSAIVSIAGRIARMPKFSHTSSPNILLTHGTEDQIVPFECSAEAAHAFEAANYEVSTLRIQALGHQISRTQLQAASEHFAKVFEMETVEAVT